MKNLKNISPNPGTDEAITAGCTCPVLDNRHGKGYYGIGGGDGVFCYSEGCPIHWPNEPNKYQKRTLDDLKVGMMVYLGKDGRILQPRQPRMDLYAVRITLAEEMRNGQPNTDER